MPIAYCTLELFLPYCHSLKEKRMVLRSLKDRLAARFNISVAEVGDNDKWQSGELGIATVGNDGRFVNSVLDEIKKFLFLDPRISVIESDIEIL